MRTPLRRTGLALLTTLTMGGVGLLLAACGGDDGDPGTLTVYSGRGQELVGGIFARFEEDSDIDLRIRYGDTAALAAALLEEGADSPADLFFAQDAGALGTVANAGLLAPLPDAVLDRVDARYRDPEGRWVGISGRARVLVVSTERVPAADHPTSIFALTDPAWRGRVGWAPTNGSFQSFVTALRQEYGDPTTLEWLRAMIANDVREYSGNSGLLQAVADGEIDIALTNHYYLWRFRQEDPDFPADNVSTDPGHAGALVNVAGAGILASSPHRDAAIRFLEYMLAPAAQQYFGGPQEDDGFEYPLVDGVPLHPGLPPLASLNPPALSLSDLADLEGTLDLLQEAGALP